jgi:hypothetical protein
VLPAGAYLEKPPGLGPVQQRQAEIDKSQIDDDRKYVADLNDQRTASLQTQQQLLNARTMAAGLPTGAWKQSVASWENILKTYAPDVLNRAVSAISQINPNDAGKFQELAKISLQMAGQAENQVAGSHGGFNLVKLYHDSFPGLETQPDAYREMMNLFLVQHQFNVDHAQAVNSYYGPAQQANKVDPLGHPYTPVSQAVDEPFLAQGSTHNPSVYVAATALLNNHPATQAMASLTDQQKVEAIQVARRADPGHVFSPNGKAAASAP